MNNKENFNEAYEKPIYDRKKKWGVLATHQTLGKHVSGTRSQKLCGQYTSANGRVMICGVEAARELDTFKIVLSDIWWRIAVFGLG